MDDLQHFRDTFITECFELLGDMEDKLLGLDPDNASNDDLNAIFRCAHSIKGGSGAFGLNAITQFTHILEALLDSMREGKIAATRPVVDTLLKARDVVLAMVTAAKEHSTLPEDYGADIAAQLRAFCGEDGAGAAVAAPVRATEKSAEDAVRYAIQFTPHVSMMAHGNEPLLLLRELMQLGACSIACHADKLPPLDKMQAEDCYLRWEVALTTDKGEAKIREVFEFVEDECDLAIAATKLDIAAAAPPPAPKEHADAPHAAKGDHAATAPGATSIRVDIDKVDRLINMVGEVVIIQAMLSAQGAQLPTQEYSELIRGIDELSQHTRELQEAVMAVRMQPVKSIFSRLPRIVRDLSQQLGKQIRMEMSGEATEVDKTIIEQLSDPLTHMIRNAVDHGIEQPEARTAKGKPAQGVIHLSAEHRGGRIVIEITDDGAGVNRARVLAKAREKGVIAPDATLTDNEIDNLIFAPGFSTAEKVTNVSGRGVGMDVVKRNIEALGGTVYVSTHEGKGSRFTISLPLTLAILDGMIVRIASEYYIIPIANIVETLRPKEGDVRQIADGNAVINVRGQFIPVLFLRQIFHIKGAVSEPHKGLVVLVENGQQQLGIIVDELVGQQQVVIKSLEDNSDPISGVSGATILGDGKVSLILDIVGLQRLSQPNPTILSQQREAA